MFSFRDFSKIPQISQKIPNFWLTAARKCSSSSKSTQYLSYDRDPAPQFFSEKIQNLLKSLTRLDLDKIYRRRTVPKNEVEYKFLTTEQVQKEIEDGLRRARKLLQMPPVVQVKEAEIRVVSRDPGLAHLHESDLIFTDITYGLDDFHRKIVVRKVDGSLETVPQSVRKRLNQLYFPMEGRKIRLPKMFEPELLRKCLQEEKYEFILDRLTVQFEPYEREFHEISSETFLHINGTREFDQLRSTRHFGPMVFFLACHRLTDNLLLDSIKRDFLLNAVEVIELQCLLNNHPLPAESHFRELRKDHTDRKVTQLTREIEEKLGKTEEEFKQDQICLRILREFVRNNGQKKAQLELALQAHEEAAEEKRRILEGLKTAHGIN
ncbi:mitochondrial ribosomal protein S22 [Sergentomyia squamirostris]